MPSSWAVACSVAVSVELAPAISGSAAKAFWSASSRVRAAASAELTRPMPMTAITTRHRAGNERPTIATLAPESTRIRSYYRESASASHTVSSPVRGPFILPQGEVC